MLHGFTRKYPPLELMTSEEMEAVHRGALYTLATSGMRIEHDRLLELLADHGCRVDRETRMAQFPPGLVEECLRSVPSSFLLRARDRALDRRTGPPGLR